MGILYVRTDYLITFLQRAMLAVIALAIVSCSGQPNSDDEALPPTPPAPNQLDLIESISLDASSDNTDTSPSLVVSGQTANNEIYIYADAQCSYLITQTVASSSPEVYTLPDIGTGSFEFAVRQKLPNLDVWSACSEVTLPHTIVNANVVITGLVDDSIPKQSIQWNWSCNQSCDYRYVINASPTHTFTNEPYSSTQTATQDTIDGIIYLHVQARNLAAPSFESNVVSVSALLDNSPPAAPSSISLLNPVSSPSNQVSPVIQVDGVSSGDLVGVYTDTSCSSAVGSAASSGSSIAVTVGPLTEASYNFYADSTDSAGNQSSCSLVSLAYVLDTSLPSVAITLANPINASNVSNYTVSGTCSENSRPVDLNLNGLAEVATCMGNAFSLTGIDVSGIADTPTFTIQANHSDLAGNAAVTSQVDVVKDTATASVSISIAPDIDNTNASSYLISGLCSENDQAVALSIGSINKQTSCIAGSWSSGFTDVSSLADSPAIVITANHSTAVEASTSVVKDVNMPTVLIFSADNINTQNQSSYRVSGACSENGEIVTVQIGANTYTPTCSSGSFITASLDVSGLADSASIAITADHSSSGGTPANQASTTVSKNTSSPSITDFSAPLSLSSSVDLSWSYVNPGGATINDFEIQYKVSGGITWLPFSDGVNLFTNATVTGLSASTSYDFRVRARYDTNLYSEYSNAVSMETKPDNTLFDSPYKLINVGGAVETNVVAFYNNTRVWHQGSEIAQSPLSAGQVVTLNTARFEVLDADKAIYAAGRIGTATGPWDRGNIIWSSVSWAGKQFAFNAHRRDPQELYVYAVEPANITVTQGTTVLDSATLSAGANATLSWSQVGSYQVSSTGTILAFHISRESNQYADPKPLLPSSKELIGIPSSSMRANSFFDSTNITLIHSNSVETSAVLNKNLDLQVSPQGESSLYQSESLLIQSDRVISGAAYADTNGGCSTPFLPTNLMRKRFAVNHGSEFVAFASKEAGSIDVYAPGAEIGTDAPIANLPLVRSGSNPKAPYRVRTTNIAAGTRFVSTVPAVGYYQPDNSSSAAAFEDETLLLGTNDEN